jgi:hypothetical protein
MSPISKSSVANPPCVHYKRALFRKVVKTMAHQDLCQQCNQRQDCGKVYEQLGKLEGPSIVWKVVLAFLLPLVVFVGSLAFFERMFSGVITAGQSQSALSFVAALVPTFVCILLTRVIGGRFGRDSSQGSQEYDSCCDE